MLTIFPYISVFHCNNCLFTPIKMHFFAARQDQTTSLLIISISLRQKLCINGFANS